MARIRIAASAAASIPTPPADKATMFLDIADLSFKAKLPDGSLIPISATEEYIQDQFANLIQDSSTINFTYDDDNNLAYLEVIQSALDIFQIPVTPTGNLSSTNVGDALNELQSSIDSSDAAFAAHTNGGPSKHDASEVDYERMIGNRSSIQPTSNDVETALNDLDDNKLARDGSQPMTGDLNMGGSDVENVGTVDGRDVSVDGAKLDTIETGATADQLASEVPVTPSGNLGSTNVQSALQELQGDIDTLNSTFEERAQDAVGSILQDTSTIEFTYDDAGNQISAEVPNAGITDQKVASGISATKIGDGSVDNAEYQRLNGVTSPIQTQLNSKLPLAGGTLTGPLILHDDPTVDSQAATKRYVDNAIQGLNAKASVQVSTVVSGTLATDFEAGDTVDGYVLQAGDRILIKNQANPAENGIYDIQVSGVPMRSSDADVFDELVSAFVFVEQGATQQNTGWTSTATSGGTIGIDPIPWVQFSSAGIVTTDGQGIERVGNELRLELDGGTLTKAGTGLKVSDQGIDTQQLASQAVSNDKLEDQAVTDSKVSASAAIQFSKMQTLTSNRALRTNGSGVVAASSVTATEQDQLIGVTSNIQTQLDNKTPISHLDGGASKHDASEIDYERADLSKTSIQATSDDVESAISDLDDNKLARSGVQSMTGNLNMGTNNVTNVGTVDGRDVSVDGAKLDTIETGATADQIASEVPVTPVGNISSTNVQSALAELDTEKVPTTRQVNAGTGLSGGGDLSADRTISMPNVGTSGSYGSANQVPVITTDAQGRVSGVTPTAISGVPAANITNTPAGTIAATNVQAALNELDTEKVPTTRQVSAGAGLSGGGNLSADRTISMPNVGTPGSYGSASDVPVITTDTQGRVSGVTPTPISGVPAANITNTPSGNVAATSVQGAINELDAEKQAISEKGAPNGYAGLDGSGKVPVSQLPDTVIGSVDYKGAWNANTNSPNLGALTPDKGDYYVVSVAGSTSLGGITDWQVGDWAIYNGTAWEKVDNTDQVVSVFGRQGAVVAQSGDYNASQITNTPSGEVSATNVQAAINELDSEKVPNTRQVSAGTGLTGGGNLSADRTISMPNVGTPGSYGSANQVPVVTTDTQGRVSGVTPTAISGVPAANIVNTPAGNISATNIQAAVNELDAEKQPLEATLTSLGASGNGMLAKTAAGTITPRTITAGSAKVSITNGNGVSGNPTIDVPTASATALTTSSVNAEGASNSLARADHTHATSVDSDLASATASTTTTSSTDVLMGSMTLTPSAGRYFIDFSTTLTSNDNNAVIFISVYIGGSQQAHTQRQATPRVNASGGLGGNTNLDISLPIKTSTIATVNGSQAIEIRWRIVNGGTATALQRTLAILKLGNS